MSLHGYLVPNDWKPTSAYINNPTDPHYLAWKLGTDVQAGTAIWVINQVVDDPFPLDTLLPAEAQYSEINDDMFKYGMFRNLNKDLTIAELEVQLGVTTDTISAVTVEEDPQWGLPLF